MPRMRVDTSIFIKKPSKIIYQSLCDFNHWQKWSPWLLAEPEAKVDIAPTGEFYQWEGSIVGAGQMRITQTSEANDFLAMDLEFIKPWKSKAKVAFHLEENEQGTTLRWAMDSRLPFYLFWMKKAMEAFVTEDYNRGLGLFKAVMETGKLPSKVTFQGLKKQPANQYVGIKRRVSIEEIESFMGVDYGRLMPLFHQNWKEIQAGHPFTFYHQWDRVQKKVNYTAAVPLKEIPPALPDDFVKGILPEMAVYSVLHQGPYRYVANAWAAGYMHSRAKQFKPLGKRAPMEVYWNSPKDTEELKLKSEILFPARI